MIKKYKIVLIAKYVLYILIFTYIIFEVALFFTKLPFDNLNYHDEGYAVFDNKNELIGLYTNIQGDYFISYEDKLLPAIQNGIVAVEDKRFFRHFGVDIIAIFRAGFQNIASGKRISGASTLSMQLIRLKMNYPRSGMSKLTEAWYAIKLERIYDKEKILMSYLNNAPFGANIYGIETASLFYFNKKANDLSVDEAAILLGVPQSPSRLRPDRNFTKADNRKLFILSRMRQEGYLNNQETTLYAHQLTRMKIHANLPANQVVPLWMKKNNIQGAINTSIDIELQNKITDAMQNDFNSLSLNCDGAVVVIEVSTGRVVTVSEINNNIAKSYSANFCINRSSGSCLKPFIYGKAFDLGLAWPDKMVSDLPISFNGYIPRNNDFQNFNKIALKDALRLSRNVPAVELLNEIGIGQFDSMMIDLKLIKKIQTNCTGLAGALGGLSVNLLDLTNAYGVFARDGDFIPYSLAEIQYLEKPKRMFTSSTTKILKECLVFNEEFNFYAKTGTSWGPRDAWCIGYDNKYSVGVWLGLKEGGTLNAITGEATAYPLLCKFFSILKTDIPVPKNINFSEIIICNESGCRASIYCADVRIERKQQSIFLPPICTGHNEVKALVVPEKRFNIIAPAMNASYLLLKGRNDFVVECKTSALHSSSYWFVNGSFKGFASRQFLTATELQTGENIVSSVNCDGESDSVRINIKILP
jgi:penicillin-binding protein 1C